MAETTRSSRTGESRGLAARVLAPVALVACSVAVFLVISSATSDDADREPERNPNPPAQNSQGQGDQEPPETPETYVVQPGDTLTGIAAETGVPLRKIERLNPDLDPATLGAGQRLRLR